VTGNRVRWLAKSHSGRFPERSSYKSTGVRRSFDAQRRTKSEAEWVTNRFEQPWRGLFRDIERSGGGTAMIVTVEGRRAWRVSLA
jgi:hypothetical protein